MKDLDALAAFAVELATLSREVFLRRPVPNGGHEIKPDGSPVTRVDRNVERVLRERIAQRFPGHGVVAEEFPDLDPHAERVWVIDPVDGTKQFIAGIPVYGTLIGFAEAGRFVLGVMDFPATGERWIGGPGYPTLRNGRAVTASRCPDLSAARLAPGDPNRGSADEKRASMRLVDAVSFAVWGAASYGFALVASGGVDVAIDTGLEPYDFAAPAAVVQGAGGFATDWHGGPLSLDSRGGVLFAGDRVLHGRALDLLQL